MALSKHRKTHSAKVAERYKELVEMHLAAGMTSNGNSPKSKNKVKNTPIRNPNRVNMTKGQKRVAKAIRHMAKANEI